MVVKSAIKTINNVLYVQAGLPLVQLKYPVNHTT